MSNLTLEEIKIFGTLDPEVVVTTRTISSRLRAWWSVDMRDHEIEAVLVKLDSLGEVRRVRDGWARNCPTKHW